MPKGNGERGWVLTTQSSLLGFSRCASWTSSWGSSSGASTPRCRPGPGSPCSTRVRRSPHLQASSAPHLSLRAPNRLHQHHGGISRVTIFSTPETGTRVLTMSFHTSSMISGTSPVMKLLSPFYFLWDSRVFIYLPTYLLILAVPRGLWGLSSLSRA